jgi:hypothetical protein
MPRDSWACCVTAGAHEYDAECEIRRLGVSAYLPQQRKFWLPRGEQKPLRRSVPLFKGYILVPANEARRRELHSARYLRQPKYLLASLEGQIWTCPGEVVFELARLENEGRFDEIAPSLGDRVKLKGGGALSAMELLVSCLDQTTAQLFSPILGGARVTAKVSDLTRAA